MSQHDTQPTSGKGSAFTTIEADEFHEKLAGENGLVEAEKVEHSGYGANDTSEIVYEIDVPHERVSIRVMSSIKDGESRGYANDAIRVVAYDTEKQMVIGSAPHTQRRAPSDSNPEGWWGNLRPKIKDMVANWRDYSKECPECEAMMGLVKPDDDDNWTEFWSCCRYGCDCTINP